MELSDVDAIAAAEQYLAVVTTTRANGSAQASVVNAGVHRHPVSGEPAVAFVTYGRAKLSNLRRRPRATLVFRSGWRWVAVEGSVELCGPDDELPGADPSRLPELLRSVFRAAGGAHDDWEEYDRVMREQRRTAVFVRPDRIYSNPA